MDELKEKLLEKGFANIVDMVLPKNYLEELNFEKLGYSDFEIEVGKLNELEVKLLYFCNIKASGDDELRRLLNWSLGNRFDLNSKNEFRIDDENVLLIENKVPGFVFAGGG